MNSDHFTTQTLLEDIKQSYPHMPEYYQAIKEVADDVLDFDDGEDKEKNWRVLRYLAEPDRVIKFRVTWFDDNSRRQLNRGWRVQFSNALGPYKGGLRFSPSVNASVLHFLGFEQTFKNSLTGLPMGGAKGGADFNPRDKSEGEVRRFCEAFMTNLARHIGPDTDIPAGDIGVGAAEIAYMFDQYRAITGQFSGVLTGKHPVFGGSCFREEATGFGCVYFADHVLRESDENLRGKRCAVSGAGNVALHTAEKLIDYEALVISLSNRKGSVYFPDGLDAELLQELKSFKKQRGDLREFAQQHNLKFKADTKPWGLEPEYAFACATENELDGDDAQALVKANCKAVFEGANMPCTDSALKCFNEANVIVAPSKAVNAGGVAVSGLEISQNRSRLRWEADEVGDKLHEIIRDIYQACCRYGRDGERIDYQKGANIAAFTTLSQAIHLYGLA